MDEVASRKYEHCYYDKSTFEHSGFRFQIINGSLWLDHLPWRNYAAGVVSHALTPDDYNMCASPLCESCVRAQSLGCRVFG